MELFNLVMENLMNIIQPFKIFSNFSKNQNKLQLTICIGIVQGAYEASDFICPFSKYQCNTAIILKMFMQTCPIAKRQCVPDLEHVCFGIQVNGVRIGPCQACELISHFLINERKLYELLKILMETLLCFICVNMILEFLAKNSQKYPRIQQQGIVTSTKRYSEGPNLTKSILAYYISNTNIET